jgi:hypothetical protein
MKDDAAADNRGVGLVHGQPRVEPAARRVPAERAQHPERALPCVLPDKPRRVPRRSTGRPEGAVRLGQGFDMSKGPDGLWYATTTPQVVGFHYYTLSIDGAVVADPPPRTFFGSGTTTARSKCRSRPAMAPTTR